MCSHSLLNSGFQSVALDGSCSVKHNVEVCVRGETSENGVITPFCG